MQLDKIESISEPAFVKEKAVFSLLWFKCPLQCLLYKVCLKLKEWAFSDDSLLFLYPCK